MADPIHLAEHCQFLFLFLREKIENNVRKRDMRTHTKYLETYWKRTARVLKKVRPLYRKRSTTLKINASFLSIISTKVPSGITMENEQEFDELDQILNSEEVHSLLDAYGNS